MTQKTPQPETKPAHRDPTTRTAAGSEANAIMAQRTTALHRKQKNRHRDPPPTMRHGQVGGKAIVRTRGAAFAVDELIPVTFQML